MRRPHSPPSRCTPCAPVPAWFKGDCAALPSPFWAVSSFHALSSFRAAVQPWIEARLRASPRKMMWHSREAFSIAYWPTLRAQPLWGHCAGLVSRLCVYECPAGFVLCMCGQREGGCGCAPPALPMRSLPARTASPQQRRKTHFTLNTWPCKARSVVAWRLWADMRVNVGYFFCRTQCRFGLGDVQVWVQSRCGCRCGVWGMAFRVWHSTNGVGKVPTHGVVQSRAAQ